MVRPASLPPSIAEAEGMNLSRQAGTKLTLQTSASEKGPAEVLSSDSKALFGAAKSQTLTIVSPTSAPVSNKGVQGKTTRREHRDRSPTAPEHPEAGGTHGDPRAPRHRDVDRRVAGPAALSRPVPQTEAAPPASLRRRRRGPFRSRAAARLRRAARTGRGAERGKRPGRTREEETPRPHAAAAAGTRAPSVPPRRGRTAHTCTWRSARRPRALPAAGSVACGDAGRAE